MNSWVAAIRRWTAGQVAVLSLAVLVACGWGFFVWRFLERQRTSFSYDFFFGSEWKRPTHGLLPWTIAALLVALAAILWIWFARQPAPDTRTESSMDPFLENLIKDWKRVPQYTDVLAAWWTPGDPIVRDCPKGCKLEDTGWTSMVQQTPATDAHRRTVYCSAHGFARIYVISGPDASRQGWRPKAL
jgi:hypothetical protein